jgi:hypothetical protein
MQDCTIKFREYISTTIVARDNYEGSYIPCTHLFVEELLDLGVTHEDEAAVLEVEVFESVEVLLLKPRHRFESGLVDFGVECIDIGGMFLQGDGSAGYEVSRRHYRCGWRLEVCSFNYVKREYGVSSCDGKIW